MAIPMIPAVQAGNRHEIDEDTRVVSDVLAKEIRAWHANGTASIDTIAKACGLSASTVKGIIKE